MTDHDRGTPSPGEVEVWDPLVRIVHWSLVLAVAIAWLSAEESDAIHEWSGHAVAALVALRIVWGIVGPREARFANSLRGPTAVVDYLSGLARGTSRRYLGHNPAGAAMAIALLAALLGTTGTGMALLAVEDGEGPLAAWLAPESVSDPALHEYRGEHSGEEYEDDEHDGSEEMLEEAHEWLANGTLALALLHVLGMFASSVAHRENLVRAMVTGRKRATDQE